MNLTDVVVLSVFGALIAFEVWTVLNGRENDTESESIRRASVRYPFIALFAGVLAGHWFLPRCGVVDLAIAGALVFSAFVLVAAYLHHETRGRMLAAGFVFGLVGGYLFWPLCVDPVRGVLLVVIGIALIRRS